jgi:transcriptional/translational regulatory protein YebC/TACO1
MFQRQGVFRLSPQGVDRDELELALIDHGLISLDDGESDKGEPELLVRCAFSDFGAMHHAIEGRALTPIGSQSEYVAATLTELTEANLDEVMELVAAFEGDDDVQNVYTNLA